MSETVQDNTPANGLLDVRAAKIEDVLNILATQNATFPKDPANLSVTEITDAIADEKQTILVAKLENQFVGYIALHDRKFRPWTNINNLIVLPCFARKGIASRMLILARRKMKRPFLRLFVEKKNKNAVSLYHKLGFVHINTKTNHYEDNDDALVMIAKR